jgi:hypothetical protein
MSESLPNQFATEQGGGSPNLSPDTSSAPSKPGGGGKALADCMGFWDAATHMSKGEWRAACKRSMKEFPEHQLVASVRYCSSSEDDSLKENDHENDYDCLVGPLRVGWGVGLG